MDKGPIIAPFSGVRYDLRKVKDLSRVTAPPYDVISEALQNRLYERDPYNIVRLILGRQHTTDTEGENRYTRSAHDLQTWLREGILMRDKEPSLYLYEQTFKADDKERVRRGFIALRRIEEFEKGKIYRHEKTLTGPKEDRFLLIKACGANFSPIFSLYSDPGRQLSRLFKPSFDQPPLADFTDEERVRHRFWRVIDRALLKSTDDLVGGKNLFIADGHHRYETAIAYRNWLRAQYPKSPENASFNYVMMFFTEMGDPGLVILPTHRILQNWPSFDRENFKKRLRDAYEFKTFEEGSRDAFLDELRIRGRRGTAFGLLFPGEKVLHLILLRDDRIDDKDVGSKIDTAVLHQLVLRGVLHLGEEEEKDPRYLKFIKEIDEGFEARRLPGVDCIFLLNSPDMAALRNVVEAGLVLPPKTTFFYPKLVTGLVMNPIDPHEKIQWP